MRRDWVIDNKKTGQLELEMVERDTVLSRSKEMENEMPFSTHFLR
jgi:hypothetical protein